ncbi:glycosyltransferase family 2 protein [Novosphingobium pentaromativorans]|uniref:Glycosyl transferase family 2 n=1 Tax=Novosphingobium pentaromativorans US6-1 TaxID=1088721 RepID=G6ELG1_9SPHN|nr:glycosyltransferase family A protein [Novosphingobium pentaromativorans]AIT82911.1 glycosyl transferase family 2 [Novosphingobium pentaromativorans US6-1]EHJ57842.1 glycosyl transferase family 2 [Novosphingobium pentaromativorans US6-1]
MITQQTTTVHQSGSLDQRVSVVIALYNYERHIAETLDSVAAQTTRDVAIIVVNDCSTDNSLDVAAEWMRHNQHTGMGMLLLSNNENVGASIARNNGITVAQSEFCFLLDADNLLYPRCLEKHLAAIESRPNVDAAYSLIEVFEGDRELFGAGVFAKEGLIHGNFIDLMAMYRRSTLLALNGFEKIRYGWEDYDLWLRMLEGDSIVLHIPEITARYRHHYSSVTRTEQKSSNVLDLHKDMTRRHPWLKLQ